jgi:hypothetical protein
LIPICKLHSLPPLSYQFAEIKASILRIGAGMASTILLRRQVYFQHSSLDFDIECFPFLETLAFIDADFPRLLMDAEVLAEHWAVDRASP